MTSGVILPKGRMPKDAASAVADSGGTADLFRIGRVVTKTYAFTAENIAAYARIAGDTNVLHLDEAIAKDSRFGGIIACAAHSTGVLISVLADQFARNGEAVGLGFDLTLRRAVKAGTTTELRWIVTSKERSQKLSGEVVELSGEVRDIDSGELLVRGEGRMLVIGSQV